MRICGSSEALSPALRATPLPVRGRGEWGKEATYHTWERGMGEGGDVSHMGEAGELHCAGERIGERVRLMGEGEWKRAWCVGTGSWERTTDVQEVGGKEP